MNRTVFLGGTAAALVLGFFAGRWTERPVRLATEQTTPAQPASAYTRAGTMLAPAKTVSAERQSRQNSHCLADEDARQKALETWAETDPAAAMRFARENLKGDRQAQAVTTVLSAWGRRDPEGAWQWVTKTMPDALYHYDTLLEVFGRSSTALAKSYADRYASAHPEAAIEVNLAALLGITYRGDFSGARAMIDANAAIGAEAHTTLLNFLAGQWARFAPEEAAAWVATLPAGPQREQALIGLGETWSEVDPAYAAQYAVALPEGHARTLALRQAISKWVMTDPDSARAWVLETNRHEDFDQAVGAIATDTNLVNRDPARALRWAATIFDDRLREQSVGAILSNWYPIDPAGATRYIEGSDMDQKQRAELLGRLRTSHDRG